MKKQRNYSKLEEQEKSPEKKNNETEITSQPDPEFKKTVIKDLSKQVEVLTTSDCSITTFLQVIVS